MERGKRRMLRRSRCVGVEAQQLHVEVQQIDARACMLVCCGRPVHVEAQQGNGESTAGCELS